MDPSIYAPTEVADSSAQLPGHLKNNTESSTIQRPGGAKEEFSVVKTKEDEDEEAKLREKEKKMSWDDKRKLEDHCVLVRDEVLSTEKSYIENMNKVLAAYIKPLESIPADKLQEDIGITAVQRATLLSNLSVIIGFQNKFAEELKAQGPNQIENVIIQYSHFFRLYSKYATDYQSMAETLMALNGNKKWLAFTTMVDYRLAGANGNAAAEQLTSYLIMPIQRIPRYELLLRELKRSTLPSLPEFEVICKALCLIKQTATHVNTAKREAESMGLLLDLQRKIRGEMHKDLQLVQPHRRHLKTATVQLSEPHKKSLFGTMKINLRVIYLFNDVLLWTNPENEYKSFFNIASLSSVGVLGDYMLEVCSSSKFLHFNFCTDKIPPPPDSERGREFMKNRDEWNDEITRLMEENQAARRKQRNYRTRQDDTRTQTHRLIVNKFNTLDRKQFEEAMAQHKEEEEEAALAAQQQQQQQ